MQVFFYSMEQILQVVRNVTTEGARIEATILDANTLQIPTGPISYVSATGKFNLKLTINFFAFYSSLGDRLTLNVVFVDTLGGLYTRIRVMNFFAYNPNNGQIYSILNEG